MCFEGPAGDERAFNLIVRAYEQPVYNYVLRLVGDRSLAEDLTQEVFLRVYQGLPGFSDRSRFTTWLFQVTKNRVLDELRALERRPRAVVALDDIPPLEVVDQPFERTETIDAVWRAVEGLTVDLKMALLLRDVVGLSYTEIADALEITLATVKWRIYKAREEVATVLARDGITARTATTTRAPAVAAPVEQTSIRPRVAWGLPPVGDRTMQVKAPTRSVAHRGVRRRCRCRLELERPADARHGDYATTVALRLAGERRQPPREVAASSQSASSSGRDRRRRRRGPRFLNLTVDDVAGRGWRPCSRPVAVRPPDRPSPGSGSRSSASPPTRRVRSPSQRRGTAPTATRSRACSSSRATTSSGSTTTTTPARRWTASESVEAIRGESRPRTAGDYVAELAREEGDPVPRMLEQIEATLERFGSTSTRSSGRASSRRRSRCARGDRHVRVGRRGLGEDERHGDDRDRVVIRSDGTPTYFAADAAYMSASSPRASTA